MQKTHKTHALTFPIHENNFGMIDFSTACIRMGIKKQGAEWFWLDEDDFRILQNLLSKPIIDGKSASDVSSNLNLLRLWAEAAIKWMEKHNWSAQFDGTNPPTVPSPQADSHGDEEG